jgi:ATP synthase F1 complex assembly factor 1
MIATFYTEFAHTHDIVLLRGEITPSANSGDFLMSQTDAQLLALTLQKFYVPSKDGQISSDALELLETFHGKSEAFDYQRLIEVGRARL